MNILAESDFEWEGFDVALSWFRRSFLGEKTARRFRTLESEIDSGNFVGIPLSRKLKV